jgi:hypothetical protein
MERVSALIEKLQGQFAEGADIEQLLLTTQLLEGELRYHLQKGTIPVSSHVAVVMPRHPEHARYMPPDPEPKPARNGRAGKPMPQAAAEMVEVAPEPPPVRRAEPEPVRRAEPEPVRWPEPEPVRRAEQAPIRRFEPEPEPEASTYNPIREVPTLTHQIPQEARKELNEAIVSEQRSLNDSLKEKEPSRELSDRLNEAPIRDLKKAVGINDRYLFISELFRGDETMYERSIKTINNFSIYQEALYWMERELKLKLAWNMEKHSTKLFYQLVKRRFS